MIAIGQTKRVHPSPDQQISGGEVYDEVERERTSEVFPRDKKASEALLEATVRPKHLKKLPSIPRLMRETGFFQYFAVSNTFLQMKKMIGKDAAKEASKSTWTTMGVVSALLTSVSLAPLSSSLNVAISSYDLQTTDLWIGNWRRCILYMSIFSFLCNISVVLMTVLLYVLIDHCFTEDHVELFLLDWILAIMLTPVIFTIGIALTIITVIASIAVTANETDFWILLAVILVVIVLLSALAFGLITYVGRGATVDALDRYHMEHDGMKWDEWRRAKKEARKRGGQVERG